MKQKVPEPLKTQGFRHFLEQGMRESNTRKYFVYFPDFLAITPFPDTSSMSEMCSIVFWCVLSKRMEETRIIQF